MLYISREIEDRDFRNFLKSHDIEYVDKSMISFEPVPFIKPEEEYSIIFFSSPRAVSFFLNYTDIKKGLTLATIGRSTSDAVEKHGLRSSFEGKNSGDPDEVAKKFAEFVQDEKVLFPQSNLSKRSAQKYLRDEQCIDLVVYETKLTPFELVVVPDILIFTSPSNVESFLKKNQIHDGSQKIIAWGLTTENYLREKGVTKVETLRQSTYEELLEVLERGIS
ncbi:MAG: uroporphyrinogen-III synthase [Brumimicrobium sp.]|nr:uroporphyrinogen-III synthase [Brumimicrobium sp.]